LPVERVRAFEQNVRDVGAVEALALLDECLGPDHLFGWAQLDGPVENVVAGGIGEPLVVDARHAVA